MTEPLVARWYTPARRLPRMIGKAPGGGTYPGGPYTVSQFIGGALTFAALSFTEGLWGGDEWLMNKLVEAIAGIVMLFVLGKFNSGSRNPIEAGLGFVRLAASPRHGMSSSGTHRRGQPVRRIRGRVNVYGELPASEQDQPVEQAATDPAPSDSTGTDDPPAASATVPATAEPAPEADDRPATDGTQAPPALPPSSTPPAPALSQVQRMLAEINSEDA